MVERLRPGRLPLLAGGGPAVRGERVRRRGFRPAARGAGVASGALAGLSAWALEEAGFWRLELEHSTRNAASCAVATKCGYAPEGVKRSAGLHDDGRHDMHLHALVRGR
ncbi:GNAT family N-acetyltransferase [Streptomyces sp. SID4923]|nr:GNAT family N-acetyltransferase [Streptomyces sp. SID4923]